MANRKPFKLEKTLIVYNLIQVVVSCWLVFEGLDAAWLRHYSWRCQPVDHSRSPQAFRVRIFILNSNILYGNFNCIRDEAVFSDFGNFVFFFAEICSESGFSIDLRVLHSSLPVNVGMDFNK